MFRLRFLAAQSKYSRSRQNICKIQTINSSQGMTRKQEEKLFVAIISVFRHHWKSRTIEEGTFNQLSFQADRLQTSSPHRILLLEFSQKDRAQM